MINLNFDENITKEITKILALTGLEILKYCNESPYFNDKATYFNNMANGIYENMPYNEADTVVKGSLITSLLSKVDEQISKINLFFKDVIKTVSDFAKNVCRKLISFLTGKENLEKIENYQPEKELEGSEQKQIETTSIEKEDTKNSIEKNTNNKKIEISNDEFNDDVE